MRLRKFSFSATPLSRASHALSIPSLPGRRAPIRAATGCPLGRGAVGVGSLPVITERIYQPLPGHLGKSPHFYVAPPKKNASPPDDLGNFCRSPSVDRHRRGSNGQICCSHTAPGHPGSADSALAWAGPPTRLCHRPNDSPAFRRGTESRGRLALPGTVPLGTRGRDLGRLGTVGEQP